MLFSIFCYLFSLFLLYSAFYSWCQFFFHLISMGTDVLICQWNLVFVMYSFFESPLLLLHTIHLPTLHSSVILSRSMLQSLSMHIMGAFQSLLATWRCCTYRCKVRFLYLLLYWWTTWMHVGGNDIGIVIYCSDARHALGIVTLHINVGISRLVIYWQNFCYLFSFFLVHSAF